MRFAGSGGPSSPTATFARARIVAYHVEATSAALGRLGPAGFVDACEEHERRAVGCRACKVRAMQEGLFDTCRREIERAFPDDESRWTVEHLVEDVATVRQMMADNGDRIDLDWPVSVVALARLVKQKRIQVEAESLAE